MKCSIDTQILDELDQFFFSIDPNKVRALIITGEGEKSFVAGADISEINEFIKELAHIFQKEEMIFIEK